MAARILAACILFGLIGSAGFLVIAEEKKSGPKHTIKEVMKEAHKSELIKKVSSGAASKEEKQKLLGLYADLWENKPPRGEEASWLKKAGVLVVSAARVVLEQEGATEQLKAAANCKACHEAHKGKE